MCIFFVNIIMYVIYNVNNVKSVVKEGYMALLSVPVINYMSDL